jgi:hypothetical protein
MKFLKSEALLRLERFLWAGTTELSVCVLLRLKCTLQRVTRDEPAPVSFLRCGVTHTESCEELHLTDVRSRGSSQSPP